jgi:membrane-associated protease RseP (regulator of RpoE activity)
LLRAGQQQTVSVVVGKKRAVHHHAFRMPMPEFSYRFFARQPMLGLRVMEMNEQLAEYFGAPDNDGVLVEEVSKSSPAAKAGFKAGDVILRVGKRPVDNMEDIRHELRKHDEGDKVEFEVLRKGTKNILSVEIEASRIDHFSSDANMQMDMYQSDPSSLDDGESEFMFNEIKPNLDNLHLNLERMRQEMQRGETGVEIKKIFRSIPDESESMIL